jgi:hypothetical protein
MWRAWQEEKYIHGLDEETQRKDFLKNVGVQLSITLNGS